MTGPKYLTGDKDALATFIDKFDVSQCIFSLVYQIVYPGMLVFG